MFNTLAKNMHGRRAQNADTKDTLTSWEKRILPFRYPFKVIPIVLVSKSFSFSGHPPMDYDFGVDLEEGKVVGHTGRWVFQQVVEELNGGNRIFAICVFAYVDIFLYPAVWRQPPPKMVWILCMEWAEKCSSGCSCLQLWIASSCLLHWDREGWLFQMENVPVTALAATLDWIFNELENVFASHREVYDACVSLTRLQDDVPQE